MKPLFLLCLLSPVVARELEFVQAFWRHGDRAPNKLPYPNDPYTESAWPRGFSQLTSIGMGQLNELGQFFRKRYGDFVNSSYVPSQAYMRSSDTDRALTSAQAFLSGFYPAEGGYQWQPGSTWQPIPVHGATQGDDDLLCKPTSVACPRWKQMVDEGDAADAAIYNEKYADMFALLRNTTGNGNFSYTDVNGIYDIQRELIHNKTELQPSWVFQTWPQYDNRTTLDICSELRRYRFLNQYGSFEKGRFFGGYLLNQWIQNAQAVAAKRQKNPSKMFWFSSHDTSLMSFMYTMGVGNGEMPPYAGCLIWEIYSDQGDYFVEVFYRNDTSVEPHRLTLPHCATPCSVSSLQNIYKDAVLKTEDDVKRNCGAEVLQCSPSSVSMSLTTPLLILLCLTSYLL